MSNHTPYVLGIASLFSGMLDFRTVQAQSGLLEKFGPIRYGTSVPDTVPTPHIEPLFAVARFVVQGWRKRLETSNVWEARAMPVPTAKLLIIQLFLVRDQEVGAFPAVASCRHF